MKKINIITGRYPLPKEIRAMEFSAIINVSDELINSCAIAGKLSRALYFWFPCTECTPISMSSIYGCMQVLCNYSNVFIHCHAGVCRSVIIRQLYLLMVGSSECDTAFLQEYVNEGILPTLDSLKPALAAMLDIFTNVQETMRGGQLDSILLHNKINYAKK